MIEEDGGLVREEDSGCCSCSACRRPIDPVRGFGIPDGGPTLEEDAERDLKDRIEGMEVPSLVVNHADLDEHDDALNPRPYQTAFTEVLRIETEKTAVGQVVGVEGSDGFGSFMSPDSVRRMLTNLPPKDIFGPRPRPLVLKIRVAEAPEVMLEVGVSAKNQGVPA